MLSIFQPKPLIDANSAEWIYATVAWSLKYFDRGEFFNSTRLVQPNNEFFPGRVSSVGEKAANIFQHTLRYSGLKHWPFELKSLQQMANESQCQVPPRPQPELANIQRNSNIQADEEVPIIISQQPLFVFYNPQQTLKPEDMSASYAHVIAQHLIIQSQQMPPGGMDYFAEASEVLAHVLGFGVLLTNSAYTFRGGCGSCYNAMANRQPAMNELESIFTLALIARIKGIEKKVALQHVKGHLHSSYKKALKQIEKSLNSRQGNGAELSEMLLSH